MKNVRNYFLFIFIIAGTISCNDDEEIRLTKENGKPSFIKFDEYDGDIYFYYEGNHITQIIEEKGAIINFKYINDELASLSMRPTDKEMPDGNVFIEFKKEDNKIIVESTVDPFFDTIIKEIELDENNIPIKITDKGLYHREEKLEDGAYYSVLLFDPKTKNLIKEETFDIATSQLIATRTYQYENTPGIFSKTDFPLWFYAYQNQNYYHFSLRYYIIYFNYSNNISNMIIEDSRYNNIEKINYNYNYNKDGFPISIQINTSNKQTMSVKY